MIKKLAFSLFTFVLTTSIANHAIPIDPYLTKLKIIQDTYRLEPEEACCFIYHTGIEDIRELSEISLHTIMHEIKRARSCWLAAAKTYHYHRPVKKNINLYRF